MTVGWKKLPAHCIEHHALTVSDLASRVREAAPHAGRLLAGVSQIRFPAGRVLLVTLVLVGALCGRPCGR